MILCKNKRILFFFVKPVYSVGLLSFLAVLAGGLIYVLFRPLEAEFFNWFDFSGIDDQIRLLRRNTVLLTHYFPGWFIYSLPDGLWAFAYSLIITVMWMESKSIIKYFWFSSIPLLVLGFEIMQLTGYLPGTFSFSDLLFGILGISAGVYVGIKLLKLYSYEKLKN